VASVAAAAKPTYPSRLFSSGTLIFSDGLNRTLTSGKTDRVIDQFFWRRGNSDKTFNIAARFFMIWLFWNNKYFFHFSKHFFHSWCC
jgi:hypothetical protein